MLGIGIVKISAEDAKERLATSQMDTVLIEETPEPVQAKSPSPPNRRGAT